MANVVAKRKSVAPRCAQMRLVSQKKPRVSFPPASGAGFSGGEQQQNPTRRGLASAVAGLGGYINRSYRSGDIQRALYALVRESVYSGAHATHARVELAYGGSHASGARDGVAGAYVRSSGWVRWTVGAYVRCEWMGAVDGGSVRALRVDG